MGGRYGQHSSGCWEEKAARFRAGYSPEEVCFTVCHLGPSERHGFPGVATRLLSVAPDKAPHRKVSPKLSISLTNNSANFSLPSGFTHRACIPECPRRFQNFLRVPECLYTPTNQASILLQGAHRLRLSHLQVLPPA